MSSSGPSDSRPVVGIYRHQLFQTSEGFIHDQASCLEQHRPLFIGESLANPVPPGAEARTLASRQEPVSKWAYRRYSWGRDPSLFLPLLPDDLRLLHAHFGVEGVYALKLARARRIPLVTTFHGFDATVGRLRLLASGNPKWITYARRRSELARDGDAFLCISDFIRRRVLALGFPGDRTQTHYIGVDTQRIQPSREPAEEPLIVHVARLVEKKGTKDLLHAFAQVVAKMPSAKLAIVGDGPLRTRLENLATSLGLDRHVGFVGAPTQREEVFAWMRRARALCLPSVRARDGDAEGLGLVLLEAAASGIPAVATQHGGIPEAVQDGRTGLLVPERDPGRLSQALLRYLEDARLAREHGREARLFVERRFDLRTQTRKLESIYKGLP